MAVVAHVDSGEGVKNNGHEYDIVPADHEARIKIRDEIRLLRLRGRMRQSDLSEKIGMGKHAQFLFERTTSWHVGKVQRISRALDQTFWMTPQGLPVQVPSDPMSTVLRASKIRSFEDWDYLHCAWVRWYLAAARQELDISSREMAERLGVDRRAICQWEAGDSDPYLHYMQRYARALGGKLALKVTPSKPLGKEGSPCIGVTT